MSFYDPSKMPPGMSKSMPKNPMGRKYPNPPMAQGEGQDISKMLSEKNNEKPNLDENTPTKNNNFATFRNSDEKNKKLTTGKSPKKSEKKPIRDTVYIKNIPNYYNSVETLSKFYKQFGSIENIQSEQSKSLATVKFMKPLDAVKAVNSNKKLFGKEDIFVTLNPDEEPPKKTNNVQNNGQNNQNGQNNEKKIFEKKDLQKKPKPENSLLAGKFSKFQEIKNKKEKEGMKDMIKKKLANKLKFLLYLKNRIEKTELKNELLNEINKIKSHKDEIEKGTFDETIKELFEKENMDPSFDFTLIINNLPENMLNYSLLQTKLEVNLLFFLINFLNLYISFKLMIFVKLCWF